MTTKVPFIRVGEITLQLDAAAALENGRLAFNPRTVRDKCNVCGYGMHHACLRLNITAPMPTLREVVCAQCGAVWPVEWGYPDSNWPRAMWINQPSTLQPDHKLHGLRVWAMREHGDIFQIYFLDAPARSRQIERSSLSEGWPETSRP